jgi:hypothetical protein
MRRFSHFLLTLEAIALVFLTAIAGVFLLGGSADVWTTAWVGRGYSDALTWSAMLLSLSAAWWLLIAYFYRGHRGARQVPVAVWAFAGLIAAFALWDAAASGSGPGPAILFVPTFVHLSAEVWLWPPNNSLERARER